MKDDKEQVDYDLIGSYIDEQQKTENDQIASEIENFKYQKFLDYTQTRLENLESIIF